MYGHRDYALYRWALCLEVLCMALSMWKTLLTKVPFSWQPTAHPPSSPGVHCLPLALHRHHSVCNPLIPWIIINRRLKTDKLNKTYHPFTATIYYYWWPKHIVLKLWFQDPQIIALNWLGAKDRKIFTLKESLNKQNLLFDKELPENYTKLTLNDEII